VNAQAILLRPTIVQHPFTDSPLCSPFSGSFCRVVGWEKGTAVGWEKRIVAALPDLSRPFPTISPSHCHPSWASSARVWCVVSLVIRVAWRALRLLHRSMLPEKNPPRAATLSTSTLTDGEEFVAVLRQRRRRQSGLHLQMTNMCCYDSCP
jgi:hypothetical protein